MTARPDPVADFVEISRQCAEPSSPAGAFWARYDEMLAELHRRGERITAALALAAQLDEESRTETAAATRTSDDLAVASYHDGRRDALSRGAAGLRRALTEEAR